MKLKIKVTKDILERSKYCFNGDESVYQNCAIALAVRDIFPNAKVGGSEIYFNEYNCVPYSVLPYKAQEFIQEFDLAKPAKRILMPEIEFEIEIPESIIQKINIDEIRPLLENHPTLQLC